MHVHLKEDAGFTLMELMVSATLLLVVMAGAFAAFHNATRVGDTVSLLADANQNLRVALNTMTGDLIQAGRNIPNGGIPIPSGGGVADVRRPGSNGPLTFPAAQDVMPVVITGATLGPAVNGQQTDMITILYEDPTLPLSDFPLAALADDGTTMTVDDRTPIDDPATGIDAGDLILFSNVHGNAIQQVTAVNGQQVVFADGDDFALNQRTAAAGSIVQLRGGEDAFPMTTASRVVMISYFIDTTTNPAMPRLVRQENLRQPRAIAMGIENLQISYDLVDDAANPVDQKTPVPPNTPHEIRKVNLFLSARSLTRAQVTNAYVRSSATTQVTLRSLSFRDRYQ